MSRANPCAVLIGAILTLVGWTVPARAALAIPSHTVDGGGQSFGVGGDYTLGGTCGQPDAGSSGGGTYQLSGGFWCGGQAVSSVGEPSGGRPEQPEMPVAFRVEAGIGNPFTTQTQIRLELPEVRTVDVRVFDHAGRVVRRVHEGLLVAGRHLLAWNGTGHDGRSLPSGVYLLQVRAGDHLTRKRVVYFR